jgi:hypothetical protein
MNKRLQYLAGIIKEDVNPYEDEFDNYAIRTGFITKAKAILSKYNIPEDSKFNFVSMRNQEVVKENATAEEAVDTFLEIVQSKFKSTEDWIATSNDQTYEDWLDDQRSSSGLPDDDWADFEPDYEMDEDELINSTEDLIDGVVSDAVKAPRKFTTWGIMFYGLTRRLGSFAWRVTEPE